MFSIHLSIRLLGVTPGVKVFLDDERIKIKDFAGYCDLYLQSMGKMTGANFIT